VAGFWDGKKVFVTGAFGFLGSWVTENLVKQNANVTVLQRDSTASNLARLGVASKVSVVTGDITDYKTMLRIFNEFEIEYCFHLAAQAIVTVANRNPLSTFHSNIRGTWNVLEAARNTNLVKGFVISSSDKVYGAHDKLPYLESFAFNASYPYDVSKACAELLAQSYFKTYGLPVVIARSGNFYGPGDLNFDRLIPSMIRAIIKNETPIIRSDGKFVRDYFYVKDAAAAFLTFAENASRKEVVGQAFNLGTSQHYTVLEVLQRLISISGKNVTPKILNQASNEIREQYLDCTKAKELLNWQSATDLDSGLKEAYKWYDEYFSQ